MENELSDKVSLIPSGSLRLRQIVADYLFSSASSAASEGNLSVVANLSSSEHIIVRQFYLQIFYNSEIL